MKKFFLSALGGLMAMGASAQVFEQVGTTQSDFWELISIPTEYAYEGKPSLFSLSETDTHLEFVVYNKQFEVERTISVAKPANCERNEIEARKLVKTEQTVECTNYTIEEDEWINDRESYTYYFYENECRDITCTDEYVYEWARSENYDIIEEREVDEGKLFVIQGDNDYLQGFILNGGRLGWYSVWCWSTANESADITYDYWYTDSYRSFYAKKTIEVTYTRESVERYINHAGDCGYHFNFDWEYSSAYCIESVEETPEGKIYFYTNKEEWMGNEYHKVLYFVWKDQSIIAHNISDISYTGEWEKEVELSDEAYTNWIDDNGGIYPMRVGSFKSYDEYGLCATQTLFNEDEKWEFLRPVYEAHEYYVHQRDRDGDGEVDYREIDYNNMIKAYEVVSEDGSVLATIDIPENDDCYPILVQWDDVTYFGATIENKVYYGEDEYEYDWEAYVVIYSLDKSTSGMKKIATTPTMRVSPALAPRNTTVNVTLSGEAAKNGGELVITDSNGRTIARNRVEAGQKNVPVTTDRMTSGVYNITLTEKGQSVENARIIVK